MPAYPENPDRLDNASNLRIKTEYQGTSNIVDGVTVISDLGTPHVWIAQVTANTQGVRIEIWDDPDDPLDPEGIDGRPEEMRESSRRIDIPFSSLIEDDWKERIKHNIDHDMWENL